MYRTINAYASQRSITFDLSDGLNNNFITDSHMTEQHGSDGLCLQDDNRHAFHQPVVVFSRPVLARGMPLRTLDADNVQDCNEELMELFSADNAAGRMRHSDDMEINFNNNQRNSFMSKRSATAPNSPGPYCKKDKKHLWKSLSAAPSRKNSIHFETLESVSVAELYDVAEDLAQTEQSSAETMAHDVGQTEGAPNINNAPDDNKNGAPDSAVSLDGPDESSRCRAESISFVRLFNRCRLERDASTESVTDCSDDQRVVDQDMLDGNEYDLLCAERVSQMTKTYNDIEAVTRLLEEKERDLELAARIGQTLLSKNKELSNRTESLEDQLTQANDRVNQLKHDLGMKDELLRFYNEDLELQHGADVTPNEKPINGINIGFLERKVQVLEDENLNLRLESAQLKSETDCLEEKEKRLVEDCIQQLAEVNQQVESLAEELHHKAEENVHQKEEITGFLAQIADLQKKIRLLTLDNMDLHEKYTASQESQRRLTKELGSMQDKYDELLEMLEEAQDELRLMKGKHRVKANGQHHHSAFAIPTDSLASELETSLQQELSQSTRRAHSWKVFETARAAKRAAAKAAERESMSSTRMSLLSVPASQHESDSQTQSAYPSDVESFASDGYSADMDSLYGSNPELGRPGIPGSNDLESALKRLAMRRANELNERDFHEEDEKRKRREQELLQSGATSPLAKSPGSVKSYNSGYSGQWSNLPASGYKMSDKLQIVKPLEGSMTLRHWQHLATPHLGGIFEERDGVQIRGEKKLDLVEEIYSLSDFEEDEHPNVHTRKEQDSSLIYTFTNSTVRNPGPYRGLGTLSSMNMSSSSITVQEFPVGSSTPKAEPVNVQGKDQDNTQSTYSMSLGLGALLQGRDNAAGDKHTVLRASAPKLNSSPSESKTPTPQNQATSPNMTDVNQRVLSAMSAVTHAQRSSLPASFNKNLPGSRSFEQVMKEREVPPHFLFDAAAAKEPSLFPPGMTGQGFLQQLKSKGYSLYGLWGGKPKEETPTAAAPDSSTDAAAASGGAAPNPVDDKASAKSVFANNNGIGVLGALTSFRRSGLL